MRFARLFLVLSLVLITIGATAQPQETATPRVLEAIGSRPDGAAGLGDRLTVRVRNLDALLETAGGCQGVVLFLSDMAVPNLPPETCDTRTGEVRFLLDRKPEDDANNRAWHQLLGRPQASLRRVSVTLGTKDLAVIPTDVRRFPLFMIPRDELAIFALLLVAFVGVAVMLSRRTSLIRKGGSVRVALGPYSFSKAQQMFWFILVAVAFVFLWMMTGEVDTLTESVLVLLGVSAGTGVAAWMIDSSRDAGTAESRGFLLDILSDGGGLAIHRVQAAAWTLVLGVVFCVTVYRTLFMPQFSFTLIALMGISAGTYVAFKLPEGRVSRTNPATAV